MRRATVFGCCILAAMCLAGCPRPRSAEFTSADLRGSNGYRGGLLAEFGLAPAADDAADEPREIVEPDVIRRDGGLLYVLNQHRGLTIVDLSSKSAVANVPTLGFPRDLYIDGSRAYVLVSYASDYAAQGNTVTYSTASRLYVVDIADPASAAIVSSFPLEGDLVDSRLVGDVLYAVSAELYWYWDGVAVAKGQTQNSWVTSVSIADESNIAAVDTESFPGAGTVIHATDAALFVAAPDYGSDATDITYVDIADPSGQMTIRDSASVPGHVADRFKMDVYDGVLRVVSSAWEDTQRVYVSTIDLANPDALATLATTEVERAAGETLFATRFDGDRAYIVTFLIVDPLFIVDLSDPANPQVTGELEVPGWSTHIVPQGDRLIALGVDDTNGRRVSVSLFDVADPANPGLVERVSFGAEWSWSSAYNDVKSLTVLDDLLIVPFGGWEESGGYDRLQFISYTPDDLALRDAVDVQGAVVRSFEDGADTYALTQEQLVWMDTTNLDEVAIEGALTLAENVVDFVELPSGLGVEVISNLSTGVTSVGGVDLDIGSVVGAHAYGESVVVIGARYANGAGYVVAKIDFSNPAAPSLAKQIAVDAAVYYGYDWFLPYMPLVDTPGFAADIATLWWWAPPVQRDISFAIGETLVIRCGVAAFDGVVGNGPASEGVVALALDTLTEIRKTGLAFDRVAGVHPSDGAIIVSSCENLGAANPFQPPLCAYYVTEVDPVTGAAGPSANVPGAFVAYDAANDVLTLADDQWTGGFEIDRTLRTVRWSGGETVETLDDAALPAGSAALIGRGGKVFIEGYDNGTTLQAAAVAADGAIGLGARILATDQWGYLVDARSDRAYFSVGGGAVAEYGVNGAALSLDAITPVMGSPTAVRFGADAAHAVMGLGGVVALPY